MESGVTIFDQATVMMMMIYLEGSVLEQDDGGTS